MRSFIICALHHIGVMKVKENEMRGACSMHTKFWLENLKERYHLEDLGVDGNIIL
jgi:hypothetical protein